LSELEQLKQKYSDEVLRVSNEQKKRLLAETKALDTHHKLEQVTKELEEAYRQIDLLSTLQTEFEDNIENLDKKIDKYNFDELKNPESDLTIDMSKNIVEDLLRLQEDYLKSETQLEIQKDVYIKQINQSTTLFGSLPKLFQQIVGRTYQKFEQLKKVQENLKNRLKSTYERFENKKNRQGAFKEHERPKNYSFSVSLIKWALILITSSAISIRAAAKVMKINSIFVDLPTPSYTIIDEWCKKIGFYIYNLPKDKNIERIWIVDFSIQFGEDKLMLVLGIDIEKINFLKKNKKSLKIGFQDVELLHMVPMKSTAYENTLQELENITERCGLPTFVVSDEGSDLAKGIRIFIENNPGIKHLHDISHKLSNILKAELEKNEKWHEFCRIVTNIKQKLKLSNIAEICPPKFRQKVRFLNVRDPLEWALTVLNLDIECFNPDQKINFITYIKDPLKRLKKEIIEWNEYSNFITIVETEIKHHGLTRGDKKQIESTSKVLSNWLANQIKPKNLKLYNRILKFVEEEEAKLSPGQTVICSSDIVESMFGKWKSMSHEDSMAGITDVILLLPLLTVELTDELILKALEDTPIQKINNWKEENFGKTMYAKRRAILHRNRTDLSINEVKMDRSIATESEVKKDRKSGDLSQKNLEKVA
jgi:hypothetical protein